MVTFYNILMLSNGITFVVVLLFAATVFIIAISDHYGWNCWRYWYEHRASLKRLTFSQIKAEVQAMPTELLLPLLFVFLLLIGAPAALVPILFPAGMPDYVRDIWMCFAALPFIAAGMLVIIRREFSFDEWQKHPKALSGLGACLMLGGFMLCMGLYDLIRQFFK